MSKFNHFYRLAMARRVAQLATDESGQTMAFLAVFMGLVLLGFLALALDVGYLFHEKRMAQSAADAAAVAAAEELTSGNSAEQTAANAVSKLNGFDTTLATNPALVSLSQSSSGNYSNAGGAPAPTTWVTAVVSRPINTFFMGAFSSAFRTVTISASATAGGGAPSSSCLCLEGGSGTDLNMSGSAIFSGAGCQVTVNSSSSDAITSSGSASICAQTISAVSSNWYTVGWSNTDNIEPGGVCSSAHVVQSGSTCNPQLTVPALPNGITCYNDPVNGWYNPPVTTNGAYTLPISGEVATNNTICYNKLSNSNCGSVTFTPGYTYYIKGDFGSGGGCTINGSGVTFVVAGNIDIANGATVNLSAPTVNGVPGVLFYVGGSTVTLEGGASSNFSGIIYAPGSVITANNGTGTTVNLDIVAQTLNMSGAATLTSFATPQLANGGAGTSKLAQ